MLFTSTPVNMATENPRENLIDNSDDYTSEPPPYTGPDGNEPHTDQYSPAPPSYPQATGQHQPTIVTVVRQPVIRNVVIYEKPNNHMACSLMNFLFCCVCLGIAAIAYSLKVDSEYAAGRIPEAIAASQSARRLNVLGVVIGLIVNTLIIVAITVVVIAASDSDDDDYYNY